MSRSRIPRPLAAALLTGLAVLAFSAPSAFAGTATLVWDPVSDSDLAGYRLYWGTSPGNYPNNVDVGNVTTHTLTNLTDCTIYYFAVKAYDTTGNLSAAFSNELSGMARPTVTAATPSSATQGTTGLNVVLTGTNFRTGATVSFSGTGITVNSVAVSSCTSVTANITLASSAATGARSVTVRNADQSSGTGSNLFTVNLADTTPPVISAISVSGITTTGATITWTTNEPGTTQVAYRVAGGSVYSNSPLQASPVTSHSVNLTGLAGGTDYEFHVISTDAANNTATSSPDGTFTTRSFDFVTVEAEAGTLTAPMGARNDFDTPLAFGGNYIWTPQGTGTNTNGNPQGKATFSLTVNNSGWYTLWVRIYASTASNDSFWQSIDNGTKTFLEAGGTGAWVWTRGASWNLSAGAHSLVLGHRDEQARADRLILTDDPDFVPTATPTDSTPAVISGVSSGSLTQTSATITWTTNEPANTQVEYGTTTAYGSTSTLDPAMVLSHTAILGNLQAGTLYHYRVVSVDRGGNITRSADFTFTTAAPADVTPPANVQNLRRGDTSP
jgi:hypothetical protein